MTSAVSPQAVHEQFEVEEAATTTRCCSTTQRAHCLVGKVIIGLGFAWMAVGPLLAEVASFRIPGLDKTKTQMASAAIAVGITKKCLCQSVLRGDR